MTNDTPIACSLNTGDLEQRLASIAEVGAESLISRETHGNRHLLRFRADEDSRQRLEAIVAAETKCCALLDLSLSEERGDLVLSIAAPEDARGLTDGLAAAFAATNPEPR